MPDIAVAHGNYFQRGGGERVADAIADTFDAPLYYGFGNDSALPDDDIERIQLFSPSWLSDQIAARIYQYRDWQFMWKSLHRPELHDYDVIIQSGNEFGWYVPHKLRQAVVKYVHSPPRAPYDMHHKHGDSLLHRAYSLVAKVYYQHTTSYPDVFVANSEVVAERCRKAWDVDPEIVYPPVDVQQYGPEHASTDRPQTFLTFSRLFRHKRTRELVEAFAGLDGARLIVGGDGPQRETLANCAPPNVDVRGYLSEAEKRRLLAECTALLFNAENEDFGIVPIEAFASGTPVIGVHDGFTQYQIRQGENGLLYHDGTDPAVIRQAIGEYLRDGVAWSADRIERYAEQFSRERFEREMQEMVELAQQRCDIDVKADVPEVDHVPRHD